LDCTANVSGAVAFIFACYGAGTPANDYFPERESLVRRAIAHEDFVASLPQRMLSHPRGAAGAVIGHVERVWSYSFHWPGIAAQASLYEDILDQLMSGWRLGPAMEAVGQRYAELSTHITDILDIVRKDKTTQPNPSMLARLWTARNDARSFVVLGDPAVKCS
jgi:hypothetical protein